MPMQSGVLTSAEIRETLKTSEEKSAQNKQKNQRSSKETLPTRRTTPQIQIQIQIFA